MGEKDLLRNCLNKTANELYVTGFSEKKEEYFLYTEMNWWYFLEFESEYLCVSCSTTEGMLTVSIREKITCNFEVADGDLFTVAPYNGERIDGHKIVGFDLVYGDFDPRLAGLGIHLKDVKYRSPRDHYVFLNSMNWDGIEIGTEDLLDALLEDKGFSLEHILPS